MFATPLFMGGDRTTSRADVQSAGTAYRLPASDLKHEFENEEVVRALLLRYTQDLIANMLGVRREGVTEAACKLQKQGAISYKRGRITVLDRPQVEKLSCECYAVVKQESDRLEAYARKLI